MIPFELTILGSNSAMPAYGRFTTSQVLNVNDRLYLIDCGEGTQIRLQQYKVRKNRIAAIFISHLHGDHVFGLPGLLTSYNHLDGREPLIIFGPEGLSDFIDSALKAGRTELKYSLEIIEISAKSPQVVHETSDLVVTAFPVKHRIQTFGYLFREAQRKRNIRKEVIEPLNLSIDQIKAVKSGDDIVVNGQVIKNQELVVKPKKARSFAFCADCIYDEDIVPVIENVDLLYFETTYLDELREQARERMHATAKEAALMARYAKVGKLITGHYSSRYKDVQPIVDEARTYFGNVGMGYDGAVFSVEN